MVIGSVEIMSDIDSEERVVDPQYSDETLLQLIAQHEVDALEVFYNRHFRIIYSLIKRIVRDSTTADEVLQETFLQVWQKAGEFRGEGSAAAWLHRIARNKSLDQWRSQRARPQLVSAMLTDEVSDRATPIRTGGASVEHTTERDLARQHVRRALNHLPAEQRLCVELAYFEGMSQREIAEQVDIPVGTVKTRIRLGIEKLEQMLRLAGLEVEDVEP
jgi:RNA polymerase sigma-70 factor, ECF subfamily